MIHDCNGNLYNVDKIIRIGPSEYKGVRDERAVYECPVTISGLDEPVWFDAQMMENLRELEGAVIACAPDYYVIDFTSDLAKPELVAVIGWRISPVSYELPLPITLNGNNNGQPGVTWPVLEPNGSVNDWDRTFTSLQECIAANTEARSNA